MEKIINIRNIALIFFAITGLLHLGSSVLLANALWIQPAFVINKVMDIPFVVTGAIYAAASLRLKLTDPTQEHKALDIGLISVIIIILLAMLAINLLIPDLNV